MNEREGDDDTDTADGARPLLLLGVLQRQKSRGFAVNAARDASKVVRGIDALATSRQSTLQVPRVCYVERETGGHGCLP